MKPEGMTFEEAACAPQGALTALFLLRKAEIKAGDRVLVFGASGGFGTAAVQLAKHFGAQVIGVCSGPKVEYVKALGADRVIDYREEDFAQSGERYDVILDTVGKTSIRRGIGTLRE
jgi:NADPH:quinone reductase-like Zn-dependent oxidoreductase